MILAYKLIDGPNATMGTPNAHTKRMSIAHDLKAFNDVQHMKLWEGYQKASKKTLRKLNLGLSVYDFENKINLVIAELESDNKYIAEQQEIELAKWNRGEF